MQTVSQSIELVRYVTGAPRARVNQFARALVDAEILPKSAGRNIKKIDGRQLLALLAAVAMAEKANEAAKVAEAFLTMPFSDDRDCKLGDAFASLMAKDGPWKFAEVEFAKTANGYAATMTGHFVADDGDVKDAMLPFWQSDSWGHFCKTSFTVSKEGIEVLRNLFARDDIEGMQFMLAPGGAD